MEKQARRIVMEGLQFIILGTFADRNLDDGMSFWKASCSLL